VCRGIIRSNGSAPRRGTFNWKPRISLMEGCAMPCKEVVETSSLGTSNTWPHKALGSLLEEMTALARRGKYGTKDHFQFIWMYDMNGKICTRMFVISTFNSLKLSSIYSDDGLIYSQVALSSTPPTSPFLICAVKHRGVGGFFSE